MPKGLFKTMALLASMAFLFAATGCTPANNSTGDNNTPTNTQAPTGKGSLTDEEASIGLEPYVPTKTFNVRPGLYVENGKLMHEGKEYRAIGVNFFSAFSMAFSDPLRAQYDEIFDLMNQYGIEYARVNWGLFWPNDYKKMAKDEKYYFNVMDAVVKSAEEHNIGLICSMFWNTTGVSDFCDEPANAWGDPSSKTRKFMERYIKIVVNRYKDSPAIWGWEFSNEFNLQLDLPNRAELRNNSIHPELGTRLTRDENDDYFTDFATPLLSDFAKLIREYDPYDRLITSGNGEPRPSQYNQRLNNTWTTDDREQMAETLKWHNPDPMDCVSIHTYDLLKRFEGTETYESTLRIFNEETQKLGKVLFVGEFAWAKDKFYTVVDAIVANKIPLAAVWAIGEVEYSLDNDKEWRAEVLKYIQQANEKYGTGK